MFEAEIRVRRNQEEFCGDCVAPSPHRSEGSSAGGAEAAEGLPALVFVPDILLSRAHGFYPWFRRRLAGERVVLSVDAARSGYRRHAGETSFDPELAAGYLLSRELQDLVHLVRTLHRGEIAGGDLWDRRRLTVVGHGKGAALALHLSRRLPVEGLPVSSVILLSPPSTLIREGMVGDHSRVHVPIDSDAAEGRDEVVLGEEFLADARELSGNATLPELMSSCEAPVLMLCGEEDPVFDVAEAERLLRVGHSGKDQLLVVEMAGHHFGAAHPFDGPTAPLLYAAEQCERFLRLAESAGVAEDPDHNGSEASGHGQG